MQERRRQPLVRALKNLVNAVRPSARRRNTAVIERLTDAHVALHQDLLAIQESVCRLSAQATQAEHRTQQLLDALQRDIEERARLAALPRARLLSERVVLEGSPSQRMRVDRVPVGQTVERSFSAWMGVTRCASAAPDVRELWERLLGSEARCGDVLRGFPSTVLDVLAATVSRPVTGSLHVALRPRRHAATTPAAVDKELTLRDAVCAVPKFTYDCPPRKLRNFGHWLLDCAPHVVALSSIAPDAVFLLPRPLRGFHRSLLSLVGLTSGQMIAWDGTPVDCARLLVFESDGRTGGGRPLSSLLELRRRIAPRAWASHGARRIYVSRRDARAKRQWLSNEVEVEEVFRRHGFEVLVMADCSLEEQVRIFREAKIVAGISGAGLADIVFSPPGTHVIALLSDSLIRWYADQGGQRSAWVRGGEKESARNLAALGDSPRFYAHLAAAFEQYFHCFVGGDSIRAGELSAFIEDVLRRVDRA